MLNTDGMRAAGAAVGVLIAVAFLWVVAYAYSAEQESLTLLALVLGLVVVLALTRRRPAMRWGFIGTLLVALLIVVGFFVWADMTSFAP